MTSHFFIGFFFDDEQSRSSPGRSSRGAEDEEDDGSGWPEEEERDDGNEDERLAFSREGIGVPAGTVMRENNPSKSSSNRKSGSSISKERK